MGYGVKVEVWGDYALFTRLEMKVERVSYDIITPSSARGLLEAIYWKPEIKWIVDRIYVCNPVEFTNVRRNEVKSKLNARNADAAMNGTADVNPIYTTSDIQQRASLLLKNVRYIIEAHFILTGEASENNTVEKHYNIMLRRLKNGQCFHQPCFGCREFPANFKLFEENCKVEALDESKDFGFMLYDLDFSDPEDIKPMFFRAIMRDGIIDLTDCEVVR
ncbi:MAG TPA: type I-C CRISPR-associated protein Cas5c [Clostridia bacterium]|nr:type I-C CRISPR-associated protein Cas5c [Clostridia bacterium]